MIESLARNQNWAKPAPFFGVIALFLLFYNFDTNEPMFWALLNIPLYLFHQTEEHFWPGGFKDWMNHVVMSLPQGVELLTDVKVFWINIILVWLAFLVFGALAFVNIGFGLLIIIFSIINCLTHIAEGVKRKAWNPGLVMASFQFILSLYAAYFVTMHGLTDIYAWWVGTIAFSVIVHILLFKLVMTRI